MTGAAKLHMGLREWILLVTLALLWSGSFFFAELVLEELPPLTLTFGRVSIAALALLVLLRARGLALPSDARGRWNLLVMGLLNNLIPFSLIFWGQTRLTGGEASILNATTPLFTVLLAHFLTADERLTAPRLAGVALGLVGVAVMLGPDAIGGLGSDLLAQAAVLGAAVSYGLAGIFGRRFAGQPPLVTAAGQVTASSLLLLPLMLIVDRPWELAMPGPLTWGALAALALASTALAYVIFFRILAAAGATNLLLVTLLIPPGAALLGGLFLGEVLSAAQLAGMGLIAGGLLVIDGRLLSYLRPARSVPLQPSSSTKASD